MEENDELYGWYFVAMDNLFGKRSIVSLILIGIELLTPMLLMGRYEKYIYYKYKCICIFVVICVFDFQ